MEDYLWKFVSRIDSKINSKRRNNRLDSIVCFFGTTQRENCSVQFGTEVCKQSMDLCSSIQLTGSLIGTRLRHARGSPRAWGLPVSTLSSTARCWPKESTPSPGPRRKCRHGNVSIDSEREHSGIQKFSKILEPPPEPFCASFSSQFLVLLVKKRHESIL